MRYLEIFSLPAGFSAEEKQTAQTTPLTKQQLDGSKTLFRENLGNGSYVRESNR